MPYFGLIPCMYTDISFLKKVIPMTTIRDIAKAANVTISTVSKALNHEAGVSELTRQKIQAIAEQLNYVKLPSAKRTTDPSPKCIGLIWPQANGVSFPHTVSALEKEAGKLGYSVVISTALPDKALHYMNQLSIRHVVLWGLHNVMLTPDFLNERELYNGTLLSLGGVPLEQAHSITIDRQDAIHKAVRYLCELGHRSIIFIGIKNEKLIGYTLGMLDCKLEYRPELIVLASKYKPFPDELLLEALHNKAGMRPTAVIVESHGTLSRFARFAKTYGIRIPDDISVISYDNIPEMEETLEVPLTTVGPDLESLARTTIEHLLSPGSEKDAFSAVTLDMELVVRGSTAEPANR